MKIIAILAAAFALCGCSITVPVAVVGEGFQGGVLKGTATASVSGGTFSASDGTLTCGGTYNALDSSPTLTIPVLCNDGRKGIIISTRDNSRVSGGGTYTLDDGSSGKFIFGEGANALASAPQTPVTPAPSVTLTTIRPSISRSRPALSGPCPCGSERICVGPRGGRYCITSGGNKRYGRR